MKRVALVGLLIVSGYLLVWGVSWLGGDESAGSFVVSPDGSSGISYTGVLLGGLPPQPGSDSDLPELVAAILGAVGLFAAASIALRRGRKPGA